MNLWNVLSVSACLLYVIPVVGFLSTGALVHVRGILGLGWTLCVGEFIKHYLIGMHIPRPAAATDCNLWCNNGPCGGEPGMPSTHSAQVVFFSTFYGAHTEHLWIRWGLAVYALLVMVSRYQKHCHTLPQLAAGAAWGWLVARCVR